MTVYIAQRDSYMWVGQDAVTLCSRSIERHVPADNIHSVTQYARYLIRSIADPYRASSGIPLVAEPIDSLLLLTSGNNMINIPVSGSTVVQYELSWSLSCCGTVGQRIIP